jgi:hypothetical protein
MNSAISTDAAPLKQERDRPADTTFHPWHFFVLMSLLAATVAVILSRDSAPDHLILLSLAIGAAGAAAFACYRTIAPLAGPDADTRADPISESLRSHLEREKALTLRSIKELEFDRAMGKLSDQDFDEMARRLRARALDIMKRLDDGGGYRDVIERELASRLKARAQRAGLCACGARNDPDARFCKSCGSRLEVA